MNDKYRRQNGGGEYLPVFDDDYYPHDDVEDNF